MEFSPEITRSLTLEFAKLAREKNLRGDRIVSLGLGEPGFATPDSIVKATIEALNTGYTRYSNSKGLIELRELISEKLISENQIETDPRNIIVTPGAKQALLLSLMATLSPYDEVINFTPCYVSIVPQIKIAEPTSKIHNIDFNKDDFSINWGLFKKKINSKTKTIIINSPNNPTGKMFSNNDFLQFIEIVRSYECYILSDEIYEKLIFDNINHISPGAFKEIQDRVITINGFSKSCSMTGWRIGYVNAEEKTINRIERLQQHMNTNTATFIQKGACEAFKIDNGYLKEYNFGLKRKVLYLENTLAKSQKISFVPPKGSFFAFLNIGKSGLSSDNFATELLGRKGVAVTPGIAFGANWDDHIRISMAVDYKEFVEGIDLIYEFCAENL
jgi:aspartate aminotransferase|tara:strand:- start:4515 stop:5678 length:1164 start_codon:yes stop_codon:yes gene_type:complete